MRKATVHLPRRQRLGEQLGLRGGRHRGREAHRREGGAVREALVAAGCRGGAFEAEGRVGRHKSTDWDAGGAEESTERGEGSLLAKAAVRHWALCLSHAKWRIGIVGKTEYLVGNGSNDLDGLRRECCAEGGENGLAFLVW